MITILVLLGTLFYMNWRLAVFCIVAAPVIAWLMQIANRSFRRYSERIQNSMGDITRVAKEMGVEPMIGVRVRLAAKDRACSRDPPAGRQWTCTGPVSYSGAAAVAEDTANLTIAEIEHSAATQSAALVLPQTGPSFLPPWASMIERLLESPTPMPVSLVVITRPGSIRSTLARNSLPLR